MRKGLGKYWPFAVVLILIVLLGIYKLIVIDVVWEGINPDETMAWKVTELPENATQVRETESQSELLRQAMFLVVPLIVVAIVYLVVGKKKNLIQPDKKALIVGMAASFLSQPLHELIHGLAMPKGSTVYIGIIISNFSGYATSNAYMNMFQCVMYHLLPAFILGILPLICFVVNKEKKDFICWFCFGFALIGLVQTAPDWFGLYPIVRQVPFDAVIQFSGYHAYWFYI